jgi:glycosyltransferase involved in cell wall biosynthesis
MNNKEPLVTILLCTYNGDKFLSQQLDSIEAQIHKNWVIIASDDGSTDETLEILEHYKAKWKHGKLIIVNGPQNSFSKNFLSLACDSGIKGDYYAFCDQDDVWFPTKLSVALKNITENQKNDVPYVYCGRTQYVKEDLAPCGMSPLFIFPKTFRNALVQSIAGGNTMVFNQSAKTLFEKVGSVDVASHDWWAYLLVTAVDGEVFYDANPQILYRQHQKALVGGNNTLMARVSRLRMLLKGRFMIWNTMNIKALNQVNEMLAKNPREILRLFEILRSASLKDRFRLLGVCGVYRQTRRGTISLWIAALIKKI